MNTKDVLIGAGVGAAVAFLLDPQGGRRRRALVRDQMILASRKTRHGLGATARDLANRSRGLAARTRRSLADDRLDDVRLIERVRAKLGRVSLHPRAIDVDASHGEVTVVGSILADEINDVLRAVASVRGVRSVVNELDSHDTADIPVLQNNERAVPIDRRRRYWAPATSAALVGMAALATGAAVMAYSVRRPRAA